MYFFSCLNYEKTNIIISNLIDLNVCCPEPESPRFILMEKRHIQQAYLGSKYKSRQSILFVMGAVLMCFGLIDNFTSLKVQVQMYISAPQTGNSGSVIKYVILPYGSYSLLLQRGF